MSRHHVGRLRRQVNQGPNYILGLADSNQSRITVLRPDGRVIADSHESVDRADLQLDRPEIARARLGETGVDVRYNRAGDDELLYVAVPVHRHEQLIAIIRTASSIQFVTSAVRGLQMRFAFGGVVIGLIAALVSLWLSRRMARPLEELRSGAQRFAPGDFSPRVLAEESEETAGLQC